jgi:hypothetical protein
MWQKMKVYVGLARNYNLSAVQSLSGSFFQTNVIIGVVTKEYIVQITVISGSKVNLVLNNGRIIMS